MKDVKQRHFFLLPGKHRLASRRRARLHSPAHNLTETTIPMPAQRPQAWLAADAQRDTSWI
ncbi:hypothetical protein MYF61_29160, partial [Klebsiella quasipneumoniae]|uniref:hypothetical protein n=1 Tax=Klebsiella quasipneumoniae TaxID=1463165 RepID=UPI0020349F50